MYRRVLGLVCLLFSCLPAAADDWLKTLMLFDAGRYEEALELATPFAEDGNLFALEMLYASYTYGYGVPVDHVQALAWLRKGAELGDPGSQDAMGHHYFEGIGVAPDHEEALRWFRLAAEQNHAAATYSIGVMTLNGHGVETDAAEGWRFIQRAAELDNPDALFLLAGTLMNNEATAESVDTAMHYLLRAAQLGQRQASAMLGVLLEDFPEDPEHRVKSAFHYQVAVAAGCSDVKKEAARALARLSPDEVEALEHHLALWKPETDPRDPQPIPGQCLAG